MDRTFLNGAETVAPAYVLAYGVIIAGQRALFCIDEIPFDANDERPWWEKVPDGTFRDIAFTSYCDVGEKYAWKFEVGFVPAERGDDFSEGDFTCVGFVNGIDRHKTDRSGPLYRQLNGLRGRVG